MIYDIVALGELLIDFTQWEAGGDRDGEALFERNPGGAPANLLAAAAALGAQTAFIGKVGDDMHGRFLEETLKRAGVSTRGLAFTQEAFTTMAFVALDEKGERSFSFARKPGADTLLKPQEVDPELIKSARLLHVGSLSMTHEPARSASLYALAQARAAGTAVSYDPNYRASLWPDEACAVQRMRSLLPYAGAVKLSFEEAPLLTGCAAAEEAVMRLNAGGVPCAAVTLGADGALVGVQGAQARVPGFQVDVQDTTGAGDAFFGAFLARMLEMGRLPGTLTLPEAAECARWGNAAAACCIQKRGGISAMPGRSQVEAKLSSGKGNVLPG